MLSIEFIKFIYKSLISIFNLFYQNKTDNDHEKINIIKKCKYIYLTTDNRLFKQCSPKHSDFEIMSNVEQFEHNYRNNSYVIKTRACEFYRAIIWEDSLSMKDVDLNEIDVPKYAKLIGTVIIWDNSCWECGLGKITKLNSDIIVYGKDCFMCADGNVYHCNSGMILRCGIVEIPKNDPYINIQFAECLDFEGVSVNKKFYVFEYKKTYTYDLGFIPIYMFEYTYHMLMIKSPDDMYYMVSINSDDTVINTVRNIAIDKMNFKHVARNFYIDYDDTIILSCGLNVNGNGVTHPRPYDETDIIDDDGRIWKIDYDRTLKIDDQELIKTKFVVK